MFSLALTVAAFATDAGIQKRIVASLGYVKIRSCWSFIKKITETTANEVKDQKRRFLQMLPEVLGASLHGDLENRR